ncbi:CAHM6 protein, partial [Erpornis zantholeuca]|nr:CAHM6 protein [Erpornis zantholeuca]
MDWLQKALDFCINNQITLGYSTLSLLTAASEHIFSTVVFKCPCNSGNMVYGSFFLLVPAFILLLISYMVDARAWRQLTGFCSRKKECCPSGTRAHFYKVLAPMTAKASVAPLTWIAVALLRANLYECAASGSSWMEEFLCKDNKTACQELFKIPCEEKLSAERLSKRLRLQTQSQLIGWAVISIIITMALISKCVSRCCSSVSYPQLRLQQSYSEKEMEVFEIKVKEYATKLAERNTNLFFTATNPEPFPTPTEEEWRKISLLCTLDSPEKYYNMIYKYTRENRGKSAEAEE